VVASVSRAEDLALATRCASGESAAQVELFRRYRDRVHSALYRVLGTNAEMEDLIQEAFIEIFRSLAGFRGEARLSTWMDRITVRVAYAHLSRKRPVLCALTPVPDLADGVAAEERLLAREAARRLYAALGRLRPEARVAFALAVIDGRPLKEVAQVMSSSLVATKVRVWRARREVERQAQSDSVLASFLRDRVERSA
jgi:RNA polymerase sigma-70 factor (ECF subfamily)